MVGDVVIDRVAGPVSTRGRVLGAVSEQCVGRQLGGRSAYRLRHSGYQVKEVPGQVLPGPPVVGIESVILMKNA